MKLPDFLTEGELGEIRLTGHRIDLMHVVEDYNDGLSAEDLVVQFPTLSLDQINTVLAFYHANKAAVDAYVAQCQAEIEHLRATTPRLVDWEELKRKFEGRNQEAKA